MHSIFVTINVKLEYVDRFTKASFADAQGSVQDETGCFRFDILKDMNVHNRFYLYEVYLDEEAFHIHLKTPHFKLWWETVENMIDGDINSTKMSTVFPSEAGWNKQKPGLQNW